jgi:group I intron endonuclease
MKQHHIYKLTSPSGKVYIGRAVHFKKRMITHKHTAKSGVKRPLYEAIRKYGWENFTKEIIDMAIGDEAAYELELKYIREYNSTNKGYNVNTKTSDGGDNWEGRKNTPEYQALVETSRKNRTGAGNGMFGKLHTEESKELQKAAAVGRYSLDWFIQRHGLEDGPIKYEERRAWLKSRNLKKDANGKFIKG